jgi:hypothetical protein
MNSGVTINKREASDKHNNNEDSTSNPKGGNATMIVKPGEAVDLKHTSSLVSPKK